MITQDELDRRAQEIVDLQATNDDLLGTVETLKTELINSHSDADAAHDELEQLRLRAFDSQNQTSAEAGERERALREAQEDLERERMEREEWETQAMRERVRREELQARCGQVEMELAQAKADREQFREERDREAESAGNLHAVLEEFQAAKEREMAATLGDLQDQLRQSTEALHAFKQRAVAAEVSCLAETKLGQGRTCEMRGADGGVGSSSFAIRSQIWPRPRTTRRRFSASRKT